MVIYKIITNICNLKTRPRLLSGCAVTSGADRRKRTGMTDTGLETRGREGKSARWKRRYRFPWNLIPVSRHLFHLSLESVTTIFTIFRRCINHAENTRGCSVLRRPFDRARVSFAKFIVLHHTKASVYTYMCVCTCVCVCVCLPAVFSSCRRRCDPAPSRNRRCR